MKRFLIIACFAAMSFALQAQTDKSQSWPFGAGDFKALTDSATSALTISNRLTFIDYGTLDAALSITVEAKKGLANGALLFILTKSDATGRNVTFSTGFKGPVLSGTASKTKLATFILKDGSFYLITTQQLD